jgi:uncharacterized membrane protein
VLQPQTTTAIPAAIFNFFMLLLLWRFSLRLLRRPRHSRRWVSPSQAPQRLSPPISKTPLEIAQERYAQGEMGDREFEEMVEHLLKSRSSTQDW